MAKEPSITLRLPWWWKIYLNTAIAFHNIGVIDLNLHTAVEFVIRHTRVIPKHR